MYVTAKAGPKLPSLSEHYSLLLPHAKEIAMGICVISNKRYMRAMAAERSEGSAFAFLSKELYFSLPLRKDNPA